MFIKLDSKGSLRSIFLFVYAVYVKLRHKDLISFSLLFNLLIRFKGNEFSHPFLVLDVGANRGQFALMSSFIFPEGTPIHSYEPLVSLRNSLFNVSNIIGKNHSYQFFAVSNISSKSSFYSTANSEQSSLHAPLNFTSNQVPIETININSLLASINSSVFLKLDTQGHEYTIIDAIDTLHYSKIKYLLIEAPFTTSYHSQVLAHQLIELVFRKFSVQSVDIIDMLSRKNFMGLCECDLLFTLDN
jgi:FkbM family methyltransferase